MRKNFIWKLVLSMVFALAAELCHAYYTKALVQGSVAEAAAASGVMPFVGMLGWLYFIEEKHTWRRVALTAASAAGFAAGTLLVMWMWGATT